MSTRLNRRSGLSTLAAAAFMVATLGLSGPARAELDGWEGDSAVVDVVDGHGGQVHQRRAVVVRGRPAAVVVGRPGYWARRGPVWGPWWRPRVAVRIW